ncbi:hypothetical protein [Pseudomonas orientalis]|uniref:hypothetical protein n=1 Tax=Pseudomonas orientalis TaxID=76758 RepID=UPI0034D6F84E
MLKEHLGQWIKEDVVAEAVATELTKIGINDELSEVAINRCIGQSPDISTRIGDINANAVVSVVRSHWPVASDPCRLRTYIWLLVSASTRCKTATCYTKFAKIITTRNAYFTGPLRKRCTSFSMERRQCGDKHRRRRRGPTSAAASSDAYESGSPKSSTRTLQGNLASTNRCGRGQ